MRVGLGDGRGLYPSPPPPHDVGGSDPLTPTDRSAAGTPHGAIIGMPCVVLPSRPTGEGLPAVRQMSGSRALQRGRVGFANPLAVGYLDRSRGRRGSNQRMLGKWDLDFQPPPWGPLDISCCA